MENKAKGFILAAAGYTIWGFSHSLTKVGLQTAPPAVLLASRFFIAFLLMNLLMVFKGERISLRGKKIGWLLLLGFLEPVLSFFLESYGILYTNASFAGIIIALGPAISFFIAIVLLKEKPTLRQKIFIWLPVIGVSITTISGSINGIIRPIGVVLLIASCTAAACSRVVNRKISAEFTAFERTYVMMMLSTVAFVSMAIMQYGVRMEIFLEPLKTPSFLFSILFLGLFCSFTAYFLVNKAAAIIPVTQISVFSGLSTVVSILSGILLLHEPFTVAAIIGAVLILIGIWNVTR